MLDCVNIGIEELKEIMATVGKDDEAQYVILLID